ncbi:MAG: ArsA family ATPase [Deltaproteobacteria bacterium]|nr:ArsA family ATPase [Deltaproteobacteria bacterium]
MRELLDGRKVLVCCGSGGVGKTTTSAALGVLAAREGRNAIVITIDPAKRLATALGLETLGGDPTDITAIVNRALGAQGLPPASGKLAAIMPDSEKTFENFIRSMAGTNEGLAKRLFKTSIYKIFAQEFSGTNEYLAMEKLFDLYNSGRYDLVILDTPPSANTLTFLDAPKRLAEFFDDRIIRWFVEPGSRLLAAGVRKALEILERITGRGFIAEMLDFVSGLFELRAQFIENLRQVARLLRQDDVAFLMVTSPERLRKEDTQAFVRKLREDAYPFWGFVVNRVLSRAIGATKWAAEWDSELASQGFDAKQIETLRMNFRELQPQLQHEADASEYLKNFSGTRVALVAERSSDVHSVSALVGIADELA